MTIFGVPWEELELQHVEGFLADAGGEALTWEAKGTQLPRPASIAKHVGGFANAIGGGYLLLGFERRDGTWSATGFDFPDDDAPVWIANIVRDRLRPSPRVDVRDWAVVSGRAAVVQIEPVAEPPCFTTDGQVFVRVAGATETVPDAAELRRLYDRGETAVSRAEEAALRAVSLVIVGEPTSSAPTLIMSLAVAPVGTADDIAARVFAPGTDTRLMLAIDAMPQEPLVFEDAPRPRAPHSHVTQDAVAVGTTPELLQVWRLRLAWDGSAAVLLRTFAPADAREQRISAELLFAETIRPMAAVVEETTRDVGGHGRAHVVLRFFASQFALMHGDYTRPIPESVTVQRWAEGEPWFDDQMLDSMKREMLRACGIPEWEPAGSG